MGVLIELSECYACETRYWDALNDECPKCGCPYIVIYEDSMVLGDDFDLSQMKTLMDSMS